ncbi:hypothetical protein DM860_016776 [Cuscuta australis]|uniref:Peptidase A1 domain-containing protein n=1 Tax=Cuscuta australis TaxID=267555 RepID=A0A328DE54_9ASTE|nr:hypothetical protein DM860_016776 [Cuscuta australis]
MTRGENLFNQIMFPYGYYCFLLLLLALLTSEAAAATNNFHTIPLTSLLPQSQQSNCNGRSPSHVGGAGAIEVLHRDHPCAASRLDESTPLSKAQILARDELRARSIRARVSSMVNGLSQEDAAATDLPAHSGLSLSTLNYVVNVSIGSPAKTLSLVFDTGSDITWTQCRPCVKECYRQSFPIFDPWYSKTYSNVSCSSPLCSALVPFKGNCSSATCVYEIRYGDGSYTVGYFAKERLSLTSSSSLSDTFDSFFFGCGQRNHGLLGLASGLLGLSPGKFSVVSQTAKRYDRIFSYCLPTPGGKGGYLEFGNRGGINNNKLIRFTPLTEMKNDASFYYTQLQSISVGGERLQIKPAVFSNAGTIIDSGTVITRLPPDAYKALKSAFAGQMMKKHYTKAQNFSLFDTCFDFSRIGSGGSITFPNIEFHFRGNVTVEIPSTGILIALDQKFAQVCLAFAGNENPADVGIFGNTQQQTLDVVYDVKNWRLGFGVGRGRCT